MSPEKRLWQRVLIVALADATAKGGDPRNRLDRAQAREWVREGGKDFRKVCSLAGIDPDGIIEAFKAGRVRTELFQRVVPEERQTERAVDGEGLHQGR